MPGLLALVLTHVKDVLECLLHLVVPLRAHSVFLDPLSLEHIRYVALNLEGDSVGTVLTHGLHVLEVGQLNTRDGLVGHEVLGAVTVSQEGLPVAGVLYGVGEETWVIELLDVSPHVL